MNVHEAEILGNVPAGSHEQALHAARWLRDRHGIEHLIVTLGSRGALGLDSRGGAVWGTAPEVRDVVDTVGAGDAFSAVVALGIHGAWPMDVILRRAAGFAADLCRVRGATRDDPELYARHMKRWSHES